MGRRCVARAVKRPVPSAWNALPWARVSNTDVRPEARMPSNPAFNTWRVPKRMRSLYVKILDHGHGWDDF